MTTSRVESDRLDWALTSGCPQAWPDDLRSLNGGFFHTAAGLAAAGVAGEPFFAFLRRGADVIGLAAGVRSPCRLTPRPVHVYLPTLPAIPDAGARHMGLDRLVETLAAEGAAAVSLDSFDACWQATRFAVLPVETRMRREYLVPLSAPDDMWLRVGTGHRRQVRRGETERWHVRAGAGSEERGLLAEVQRLAAERAAVRGDGFLPTGTPFAGEGGDPDGSGSGATTFVAYHGPTALAAAMVGWSAGRAFYVMGGSTAAGYRAAASIWLHWRIMCRLAESGFTAYNLGGTPPTAELPQDAAHGLYRFKLGFGSTVVPCCSVRWTLSVTHERLHQLGGWIGSALGLEARP